MRYHIDTIPVWDALKQQGECPLCALRRSIEAADVDRFLGGSVMEPDTRVRVNEKGFCQRHHVLLYAQQNRLGHALMTHTHLKETAGKAHKLLDAAAQGAKAGAGAPAVKRALGKGGGKEALLAAADGLDKLTSSCILCDSIQDNMNRYAYTFLHLYANDAAFCKALHTVNAATGEVDTWGFLMLEDTSFIQGGLLWSTGSPLVAEGGTSPALENKSLLRLFSDWRRWVDEGWCKPYAPTNASAECTELFYRGKLAAFIASCGSLGNIKKFAAENGFELGVSYLPYYDEPATGSGGGNICLINGNSDEQLRAGWEFINFIMQDEWVALNAIKTGYVPGTKSVAENETMKAAWAEDPNTRVAYDQLAWAYGNETPYFPERMEFVQIIAAATSLLIQEQSITPEEAFEQVQNDSAHLFN